MSSVIRSFAVPAKAPLVLAAFNVSTENGSETFPANPKVDKSTKAMFLKNVEEKKLPLFSGDFTASKLEISEEVGISKLKELLTEGGKKKPLFCIHGFQGRPDIWINMCNQAQEERFDKREGGTKYNLIPVLWPANGNLSSSLPLPQATLDYYGSRSDGTLAAKKMTTLFQALGSMGMEMDIVAVSMGNWVLKDLAKARNNKGQDFTFDNIFMSAADVRGDIFSTDEGKHIVDMLSPDGKACVFYNENDKILELSSIISRDPAPPIPVPSFFSSWITPFVSSPTPRLGWKGIQGGNTWGEQVRAEPVTETQVEAGLGLAAQHGYLFESFAIDIYEEA